MNRRACTGIVALLLGAAAACGGEETGGIEQASVDQRTSVGLSDAPDARIANRAFTAVKLDVDGEPYPLRTGWEIQLTFRNIRFDVSTGCSISIGTYATTGNTLMVDDFRGVGCGGAPDQSLAVSSLLDDNPSFTFEGDTLTLTTERSSLRLLAEATEPERTGDLEPELLGSWEVAAFGNIETGGPFPSFSDTPAVLHLRAGGSYLFDGCVDVPLEVAAHEETGLLLSPTTGWPVCDHHPTEREARADLIKAIDAGPLLAVRDGDRLVLRNASRDEIVTVNRDPDSEPVSALALPWDVTFRADRIVLPDGPVDLTEAGGLLLEFAPSAYRLVIGCEAGIGTYRFSESSLVAGEPAPFPAGCDPTAGTTHQGILDLFEGPFTSQLADGVLTLEADRMSIEFIAGPSPFNAPATDEALWIATDIVHEDGQRRSMDVDRPAVVNLADGHLNAVGRCYLTLSSADDGTLSADREMGIADFCDPTFATPEEFDHALGIESLFAGSGIRVETDGRILTLASEGTVLTAVAAG